MKNLMIAFLGMLCTVVSVGSVNAAGLASSYLSISNARLQVNLGTSMMPNWQTATNGVDVNVLNNPSSSASGVLAYSGSPVTLLSAPALDPLDVTRTSLGPGAAGLDNVFNNGTPLAVANFSVGDTEGTGSLINGVPMFPPAPVNATTFASVGTTASNIGSSRTSASAGGAFQSINGGQFRYIFDASYRVVTNASGVSLASAGIAYSANITIAGTPVTFSPPQLNFNASGNTDSGLVNLTNLVAAFNLVQGDSVSFSIAQSSTASISAVPEPASMAIVGVLSAVGFASRRVRRMKK
jgi:hypothetical protein